MSEYGIRMDPERAHSRAPITAVSLVWWKKEGDDYRATQHERQRSKIGRKARLRGEIIDVAPALPFLPLESDPAGGSAFAERVRATGAAQQVDGFAN